MVQVILPEIGVEIVQEPATATDSGHREWIQILSVDHGHQPGTGDIIVEHFAFSAEHADMTQGVGDALDPGLEFTGIELQPDITPTDITPPDTIAGSTPAEADILI